jgi:hypothetical protein
MPGSQVPGPAPGAPERGAWLRGVMEGGVGRVDGWRFLGGVGGHLWHAAAVAETDPAGKRVLLRWLEAGDRCLRV